MTYRLPGQRDGFVVSFGHEPGVSGDAVVKRERRIARAEAYGALRRLEGILRAAGIGERQRVISLRHAKVRVESQRRLELRQRIGEPAGGKIDAAERGMRPSIVMIQ